jgi:glutamate racemase
MAKIVVFDSGFGSLSIIKAIRKKIKADIVYFADQKNFPYGLKSEEKLEQIITKTITMLKKNFHPDLIIIGSNTPSLLFENIIVNDNILIGVYPPLFDAMKKSQTKHIGIIATKAVVTSRALDNYIEKFTKNKTNITKIDGTKLIDLVESGKFIRKKEQCLSVIKSLLADVIKQNNIDVITLSSTHLPFLTTMMKKLFKQIQFLDPANEIANKILKNKNIIQSDRCSLKIFTSANPILFQNHLKKIGIKNKVIKLNL